VGVVVAWVSRHPPLPIQIRELKRKMGEDAKIVRIVKTFTSAGEVLSMIRNAGAEYAVLVLPLGVIEKLVELDRSIVWLRAEMVPVHKFCKGYDCELYDDRQDVLLFSPDLVRHLRFDKFVRIKRVVVETEEWT